MLKCYGEAELLEMLKRNEFEEDSPIRSVEDLLGHLDQASPMMWVTVYVPEVQSVRYSSRDVDFYGTKP